MRRLGYLEAIAPATKALACGNAFLTVKGETDNTMTIAWGSIGFYWGKPVFTVVVRPQRHTYKLINAAGEFTVSLKTDDSLKSALTFCGTRSGRDFDKFDGHGITKLASEKIETPVVAECDIFFECKILLSQPMTPDGMADEIRLGVYEKDDFHTLYFGEILSVYTKD